MHYKQAIGIPPSLLYPMFIAPPVALMGITYYMSHFPKPVFPTEPNIEPALDVFPPPDLKTLYELAKARKKQKELERLKATEKGSEKTAAVDAYVRPAVRLLVTGPIGLIYNLPAVVTALLLIPFIKSHIYPAFGQLHKAYIKSERKEEEIKQYRALLHSTAVRDMLNQGMPEVAWVALAPKQREKVIQRLKAYGFEDDEIRDVIKDWESQIDAMNEVAKEYEKQMQEIQEQIQTQPTTEKTAAITLPTVIATYPLLANYFLVKHLNRISEPLLYKLQEPGNVALKKIRKLPEIKELESELIDVSDIEMQRLEKNVSELFDVIETIKDLREELEKQKAQESDKERRKQINHEIKRLETQEKETKRLMEQIFERSPELQQVKTVVVKKEIVRQPEQPKEKAKEKEQKKVDTTELAKLFLR